MRTVIYSLMFLLLSVSFANGQIENTMYFMKNLPQSVNSNPAFVPDYKYSVNLPSAFISASNSGFAWKDVFTKKTYSDGDSLLVDLDKFYATLNDKNYIDMVGNAELFGFGFRAGRSHISFSVNEKVRSRFMYPKDLFGFFIKGNAALLGESLDFAPAMDAYSYLEVGIGGSYLVDKNLTVGGRMKFLRGQGSVSTKYSEFTLTTNEEDYSMTIAGNALVETSGVNQFMDKTSDPKVKDMIAPANKGIAWDFGATYRINNRMTAGLSLIDLGSIKWTHDTKSYSLDKSKAKYTFEGVDLAKVMNGDDNSMEELADSLQTIFKPEEKNIEAFRTWLPAKLYGSFAYQPTSKLTLGAIINVEKFQNRVAGGFSASAHQKLGSVVAVSLSYSVMNRSYNNFGAGLTLKFGPLQTYFISDNMFGAAVAVIRTGEMNSYINGAQNFNFRMGMNLVFGKTRKQEKQSFTTSKPKMR
jgi:hypothetical protein